MTVLLHLYLLQHVLELDQKLLGVFGFVGDAVQGLGELTLQREKDNHTFTVTCVVCSLHHRELETLQRSLDMISSRLRSLTHALATKEHSASALLFC